MSEAESTAKKIRNIRRQKRKKYSVEEKIRIVIEGLRGDENLGGQESLDNTKGISRD